LPTVKKFEDLNIWSLARELNRALIPYYKILKSEHEFALMNQIRNAAGSVMDNIAEGFERDGNKELIQFLSISKGSLGEVRSQLYRMLDSGYINEDSFGRLKEATTELSKKIAAFINYLVSSEIKGNKFKQKIN
jgi:four helix bundle protein